MPDNSDSDSKGKPVLEIEQEEIFEGYSEDDLTVFVREFYLIFSILDEIDKDYAQLDNNRTTRNIKKFKDMIKDWNKKYKDILLEFVTDGIECKLHVFFDDKLSDISGIIKQMNRFIKFTSQSESRINAVFQEGNSDNENSLTLELHKDKILLIYAKEDMVKPNSPEFRLCAYYALKNGFDDSVDLENKYSDMFSFSFDEIQKFDWQNRWIVRFGR